MLEKNDVLAICRDHVAKREDEIRRAIHDAHSALADETKSSAGDKYETSREMIQQDLNRFHGQLTNVEKDKDILQNINTSVSHKLAALGSLVYTDTDAIYFIVISIGLLQVKNQKVFVVSPLSPIGQLLRGKRKKEVFLFNNQQHTITEIR